METIKSNGHSLKISTRKLSPTGQFTGEWHHRTIGPEADISAESERVQAFATAARIGYVRPEPVEVE